MSRVTSKLQVTIPKAIADRYGIEPGAEIAWLPAGEAIRVVPHARLRQPDPRRRLQLFDSASERQLKRDQSAPRRRSGGRGWTRDDLYGRALPH